MSGLVNKVKDALHSDKSNTHSHTEGTHTTGTHTGTHGTTGGLHEPSHLSTGTHEGAYSGVDSNRHNFQKTDGPHGNLGNKLDPRVDSDRDHSRNLGANPDRSANTTSHTQHSALGGSHHTTGLTGSTGHTTGHTTGLTGTHGTTGGLHEHSNLTSGTQEGAYAGVDPNRHNFQKTDGPHGNIGNKLDPRVVSDRDHSRNLGANPDRSAAAGRDHTTLGSSTGTTGLGSHTGHTGHTTGHSATGAAGAGLTSASGPAPNTLGPHKSDVLNKVDPRVDSDADGSKTYGGNKTFSQ